MIMPVKYYLLNKLFNRVLILINYIVINNKSCCSRRHLIMMLAGSTRAL